MPINLLSFEEALAKGVPGFKSSLKISKKQRKILVNIILQITIKA